MPTTSPPGAGPPAASCPRRPPTAVDAVVDRWASARFLSLDRHPRLTLCRPWRSPTRPSSGSGRAFAAWIDQDRRTPMVLGYLREAAASWVRARPGPGALYRGAQLQVAIEAAEARAGSAPGERARLRRRRGRAANGTAERPVEHRRNGSPGRPAPTADPRAQLVVIGVALVVVPVGGLIAVDQRSEAEAERRDATARSLAGASSASLVDDPERSILLALAAVDATRNVAGRCCPRPSRRSTRRWLDRGWR